jgi:hypothetical protein
MFPFRASPRQADVLIVADIRAKGLVGRERPGSEHSVSTRCTVAPSPPKRRVPDQAPPTGMP